MKEAKGADPKRVVAVQMFSIGMILFVLGGVTLLLSHPAAMAPFIRRAFLASIGSIILIGLAFAVGGVLRLRRAKRP